VKPFLAPGNFDKDALYYYSSNQTTRKWEKTPTYGGKLVENVIQAIARDCLAVTLNRLAAAGYQTVMTIHDEVVLDVPAEKADLDQVVEIMKQPIEWAPGLPLNADGFVNDYYKKDD
jgi:DNA polymerase